MNPKAFALLLIISVLFMSFPWEAYAISQSFQDEICEDASDEAKDSIKRLAPQKNPTSAQSRQYYEESNFYRVQAEQLCRNASRKAIKVNIEGVASAAVSLLATLTQTYGDSNRFSDMCREFLDSKDESCDQVDLEEFDNECRAFLEERIGQCTERDMVDFLFECDEFMTDRVSYCDEEKTDALLDQFAGECKVFFDQQFPLCADVEEEVNLVQQYTDMCKEFLDEGKGFCLDLLNDVAGYAQTARIKVLNIATDAAWKIPYAVLREVAMIAVKVAGRLTLRRIISEFNTRAKKILKVHEELVELCEPDALIQKAIGGDIPSFIRGMAFKILNACVGDFF